MLANCSLGLLALLEYSGEKAIKKPPLPEASANFTVYIIITLIIGVCQRFVSGVSTGWKSVVFLRLCFTEIAQYLLEDCHILWREILAE